MAGVRDWTDEEERDAVRVLEHPLRVEAFDLLMTERLTAREISGRLRKRENVVNYHCRQLIKAGCIEVVEVERVPGTEAKILRPTPLGLYAREWI